MLNVVLIKINGDKMKRSAILIGSPGKTDFLRGVKRDLEGYKNLLCSQVGGEWYDSEIVELYDQSKETIKATLSRIQSDNPDMLFVLFTGHGNYSEIKSSRRLYTDDENFIYGTDLFNLCSKQITVIDTCAGYEDEPLFESTKSASIGLENFSIRLNYRELYDEQIAQCPNQQIKLFACDTGEFSGDTSKGGLYSYNLVKTVSNASSTMTAIEAHEQARQVVKVRSKGKQNPQYETSIRHGQKLPIAVQF